MNLDSREEIQSVKSVFSIFHSSPLKGNNKACKTNTHVIFIPWKNNNINDDIITATIIIIIKIIMVII